MFYQCGSDGSLFSEGPFPGEVPVPIALMLLLPCGQAVDPPGDAKSDLDIWLDYARRMDFRDKSDNPLIKWKNSQEAFETLEVDYGGPALRLHR